MDRQEDGTLNGKPDGNLNGLPHGIVDGTFDALPEEGRKKDGKKEMKNPDPPPNAHPICGGTPDRMDSRLNPPKDPPTPGWGKV